MINKEVGILQVILEIRRVNFLIYFFIFLTTYNLTSQELSNSNTLHLYGDDYLEIEKTDNLDYEAVNKLIINNSSNVIIPKKFKKLINLKELIISNVEDFDIKKNLDVISSYSKLEAIEITNSGVVDVPNNFFKIDVKSVSFSKNKIKKLPRKIKCFKGSTLDLSYNNLSKESIEKLAKNNFIEELFLQNCMLNFFPTSTGKMKNLRLLDLSDNQIKKIKPFIKDFDALEFLILKSNPLNSNEIFHFSDNKKAVIVK